MQFTEERINHIIHKYNEMFETLAEYDRTRIWPIGRARIDVTLSKRTIQKLKALKAQTGKPLSHIIEDAVEKLN
jgi:hypothetical protein